MHVGQMIDKGATHFALNPWKCHIALKKLINLGYIISQNGAQVDPDKTRAMSEFPVNAKTRAQRFGYGESLPQMY